MFIKVIIFFTAFIATVYGLPKGHESHSHPIIGNGPAEMIENIQGHQGTIEGFAPVRTPNEFPFEVDSPPASSPEEFPIGFNESPAGEVGVEIPF